MKKLIFATIAITSALNAFAQGTVLFNNRVAGIGTTHVYTGGAIRTGNGPGDVPTGGVDYTGYVLIGTVGGLSANFTFAQLIGAPGSSAPESSMQASLTPPTSFRTGAAAGNIVGNIATFANIPPDAPVATFEMVVWDNSSGLYPTWALASVGMANGQVFGGHSAAFTVQDIGGTTFSSPPVVSSIPGQGLQSFSMAPEPATGILAAFGVALLIFRRRK